MKQDGRRLELEVADLERVYDGERRSVSRRKSRTKRDLIMYYSTRFR